MSIDGDESGGETGANPSVLKWKASSSEFVLHISKYVSPVSGMKNDRSVNDHLLVSR